MKLRQSKKKGIYKEPSDDEKLYKEMDKIYDINKQTNEWTKHDQESLKIYFEDSNNEDEIVSQINELNETYEKLKLPNWERNNFLLFQPEKHDYDRHIMTIIQKISYVVAAELANTNKETKIDSFMLSLLTYLQFDYYPLSINPQYKYKIDFGKNQHISSIVEYMITRSHSNGTHIILFVEDKHMDNVSAIRNWEEPQIAGEIFGSAHHNGNLYQGKEIKYPFPIYAVRVVGTRFTFYKSVINREYLEECQLMGLPKNNKMIIKRYPKNSNPYINAWDFCIEKDRLCILKMLKSIEDISMNMDI